MELTLVIDLPTLEEIIEAHSFKDTLTNNYLLSKQYINYIEKKVVVLHKRGKLVFIC